MVKRLVPGKIIIEFVDGNFTNGVILYKVNEDGILSRPKSVGINDADFSKPVLNGLIQRFAEHARRSEEIPDDMPPV